MRIGEHHYLHAIILPGAPAAPGTRPAPSQIVVLSARYRTTRLLTFDERHFRAIKPLYGEAFTILPADARPGDA